jgi:hypothetical protein
MLIDTPIAVRLLTHLTFHVTLAVTNPCDLFQSIL